MFATGRMGRIRKAYRYKFQHLLRAVHARKIAKGIEWLDIEVQKRSVLNQIPPNRALMQIVEATAAKPAFQNRQTERHPCKPSDIQFVCDAGLGGLARWLRASGYEALWKPGIPDDALVEWAIETKSAILTTDSLLMERRVLRDQVVPAFWLPPTLTIANQLLAVFREFRLSLGPSRCMSCGGNLRQVPKEEFKDRIPPRTFVWLDEYFVCQQCGKLFWHGTHWGRIRKRLCELAEDEGPGL